MSIKQARETYSVEDIAAEQAQIQAAYQTVRFTETMRATTISCYKKCHGKIGYPYVIDTLLIAGKQELCFGDCMNINLEKGPFLKELGKVPEDAVPKKFLWSHTLELQKP